MSNRPRSRHVVRPDSDTGSTRFGEYGLDLKRGGRVVPKEGSRIGAGASDPQDFPGSCCTLDRRGLRADKSAEHVDVPRRVSTLAPWLLDLDDARWLLLAECAGEPLETFYPANGYPTFAKERALCRRCEVIDECRRSIDHAEKSQPLSELHACSERVAGGTSAQTDVAKLASGWRQQNPYMDGD